MAVENADQFDWDGMLRWFSKKTGLVPGANRDSFVRLISSLCQQVGAATAKELIEMIESDRRILDELLDDLTVNETYFFRDADQLNQIQSVLLPNIGQRSTLDHIRCWSAGCATGEEVWTLAVILHETRLANRASVLGTDISPRALQHARQGRYRPWSMRGEGKRRMARWTTLNDGYHVVSKALHEIAEFRQHNLLTPLGSAQAFNLILCRNVLIYFDRDSIRQVGCHLYNSLAPGGWLITSPSDPSLAEIAPFEVVTHGTVRVYVRPRTANPSRVISSRPSSLSTGSGTASYVTHKEYDTSRSVPQTNVHKQQKETREQPRGQFSQATPGDNFDRARLAFDRGDYAHAANLLDTQTSQASVEAALLRVRALANIDLDRAIKVCGESAHIHATEAELHCLHATLLIELGEFEAASQSARRAVFLDPGCLMGWLVQGISFLKNGDRPNARRAFERVRLICSNLEPDALVPFSDGDSVGNLLQAAEMYLELIDGC